jgi:hypothetical protein
MQHEPEDDGKVEKCPSKAKANKLANQAEGMIFRRGEKYFAHLLTIKDNVGKRKRGQKIFCPYNTLEHPGQLAP